MARFEDMLPDARAGLPGAADFTILNALRRSAAELCRQSEVWQQQLDAFAVQAGVSQYDLSPPSGARVARIIWLKYDGTKIYPLAERGLQGKDDGAIGPPTNYSQSTSAQTLTLYPTPGTTDTKLIEIYATLVPLPNATTLPDDLAIEYRPGIVAGAKAELMAVSPSMPYHNPQEAAIQGAISDGWITRAKRRNASGALGIPLRADPRRLV